jgi:hypothetical protein
MVVPTGGVTTSSVVKPDPKLRTVGPSLNYMDYTYWDNEYHSTR